MPESIAGADALVEEPKLYGNEATVYTSYTSAGPRALCCSSAIYMACWTRAGQ